MILRKLRPEARPRAIQIFFSFSMLSFAISSLGEHLLELFTHPEWVDMATALVKGISAGLLIPAAILYLCYHKNLANH